jgi:hypothetical protein
MGAFFVLKSRTDYMLDSLQEVNCLWDDYSEQMGSEVSQTQSLQES